MATEQSVILHRMMERNARAMCGEWLPIWVNRYLCLMAAAGELITPKLCGAWMDFACNQAPAKSRPRRRSLYSKSQKENA
jgi:hypothetical protein